MICDRAGSGKVKLDHEGGSWVNGQSLGPFEIFNYDDLFDQ